VLSGNAVTPGAAQGSRSTEAARTRVTGAKPSLTVPAGTFHNALVTIETSVIEPGMAEKKYNAPGLGVVKEQVRAG
jgi:hypothetical protein